MEIVKKCCIAGNPVERLTTRTNQSQIIFKKPGNIFFYLSTALVLFPVVEYP